MKVGDIVTRVRNIAGDTNVLQFTDSMVVDWINDGIRQCAVDNNLLQKRGTQVLAGGTDTSPLPTDILKLHSIKVDGDKLQVLTLEQFEAQVGGTEQNGRPHLAYVWAGVLNLYPKPTTDTTLSIDYTYDPPNLVATGDGWQDAVPALPVGYHSRLVDYCLAQVAQQDDDSNRYLMKMEEFNTGVQKLNDQQQTEDDMYPTIGVSARDSGGYDDWVY